MNRPVTGIIHVHSEFSSDGLYSVSDLADFAREAGHQFVGLTDHEEDLSSEDMRSLRWECEKYSNESFVIIPGLEFRCSGDLHILALGITSDLRSRDAVTVATHTRATGGLAILAHPSRSDYQCPQELCGLLDGIEVWNAAYDGRFVPPLASLRLLQEARGFNPAIFGFGGADLHRIERFPGVVLELQANGSNGISARMVLQYLRSGRFVVRGRYLALDAHAMPNWLTCSSLWTFRKIYEVAKAIRDVALGRT